MSNLHKASKHTDTFTMASHKVGSQTDFDDKAKKKSEYIETLKCSREVINKYFNQHRTSQLVQHQLESFNKFYASNIPEIIQQYNPISILHGYNEDLNQFEMEVKINFQNVHFTRPVIHENNGSTQLMWPSEARLRNFTYASPLYVDIIVNISTRNEKNEIEQHPEQVLKMINIGKIPLMLKSDYCMLNIRSHHTQRHYKECAQDPGGYFIINGNEKVIVSQERMAENYPFVFKTQKSAKKIYSVDVKSVPKLRFLPAKACSISLYARNGSYGHTLKITFPHLRQDIPVMVVFRALGIETDKDIILTIIESWDDPDAEEMCQILKPSLEETSNIQTQPMALEYILKYINIIGFPQEMKLEHSHKIAHVQKILQKEFLPHIGDNFQKKSYYIGHMIKKLLLTFMGRIDPDDRDSYKNKRVDTAGMLLSTLFRQHFTKLIKDMRNIIIKEINNGAWKASNNITDLINNTNIYKIMKGSTIETGLRYALATGNWGNKNVSGKVGIAQVLSRLSHNSSQSHLRRVNAPVEKTGKLIPPRKLHATQWGYVCPAETPEGGSVGVVKNLAMLSYITHHNPPEPLISKLKETDMIPLEDFPMGQMNKKTKVIVNGDWIGVCDDLLAMTNHLRGLRRRGLIDAYTSITPSFYNREIHLLTESGRVIRPVYRVMDNQIMMTPNIMKGLQEDKITWTQLITGYHQLPSDSDPNSLEYKIAQDLSEGIIELLDPNETESCLIAESHQILIQSEDPLLRPYTHCEIDPACLLGVLASSIPYPDHNQSPRNTYQSAMGKQAMGIYTSNFRDRMDTMGHILSFPQRPLVSTRTAHYLDVNSMPSGINVIVAIGSHSGYNQEDSIIFNQSSIDRGLFRSTFYRMYRDEEKKNQLSGEEEKFCLPDRGCTRGMKSGNYEHLASSGIAELNHKLQGGDIVIGKVIPIKSKSGIDEKKYKDNSTPIRHNESGVVDKVYVNRNGEGYRFCKVRTRTERIPQIGDKFSSRHGQKGTVGMTYAQEDMPFSKNGIVPDIIINPHAIPSRMTIGQLFECLMGKSCVNLGLVGDGSPFTGINIKHLQDQLRKCGFEENANEVLYNGRTGEQMECSFMIGPTYYQRLKHMVEDKIHSRDRGPVVMLTRQPAEGRSRDGGLRFGEMERDCILAHGAPQFLKERHMEGSDGFKTNICTRSGMIAAVNPETGIYNSFGENYTQFSEVHIPFACKLLFQELQSMGIAPRILT